jgi:quinol monooxygenase YgiN
LRDEALASSGSVRGGYDRGDVVIQRSVRYRVREEAIDEAREAIVEFVAAVREVEARTISYHAYQFPDDPTRFAHTMTFEDEEGRSIHVDTPHVRRFVDRLYPLCEEQPAFEDIVTVASSADPRFS